MLGVVCHDAGGAEVIASYVARNGIACRFVLEGPAVAVFRRRLGAVTLSTLEEALGECDEFLCGTSWQSDLEWRAVARARAQGKFCRSFLDHWGHYRERFVRGGVSVLPDQIWVGDGDGLQMARAVFPDMAIALVPNPHFQDIREEIDRLPAAAAGDGLRVLFVCEPLSEHGLREFGDARHWGYTEFDALRYFHAHRQALGAVVSRIVIRPHPSESPGKYDAIGQELGAEIGGDKSLLAEIAECHVVAGCESMAMVIGLIAGRRVVSVIPPGGRPCSLPQLEIGKLQLLVNNCGGAENDVEKNT